jgi:iron complex transport system permease protein
MTPHVTQYPWLILRSRRPALSFKLDRRVPLITTLALLMTIGLMIWNVGTGEYPIAPLDVLKTIFGVETGNADHSFVVNTLRLPRVLVAWMVGVMLALAGGIMQSLTRNALASPDITGVTAGASLGAVLLLVAFPQAQLVSLPVAALIGGLVVAFLIYILAWRHGDSPIRLILVGIGLSAVLGAAQSIMLLRAEIERVQQALYWLTGSIYARTWDHLFALLPWFVVLVPLTLFAARHLNTLHLGEEVARGLGNPVSVQRGLLLLISVGLTGAAVSQVGAIGFVGLIAPHLARRLVGPAHEGSQPVAGLIGGLLVLASDFAGRTLLAPIEVPAGIIIALIGTPFFIYLLWRQRSMF